MSENMKLDAELRELEARLAGLSPAKHAIDRDALLYEAGRAAGSGGTKRVLRLWQGAFGMMVLVCTGLVIADLQSPKVVEHRGVPRMVEQAPPPMPRTPPSFALLPESRGGGRDPELTLPLLTYIQLRQTALTDGLNAAVDANSGLPRGGASGGGGAGPAMGPALKSGDGLEALPAWQKRAATFTGVRS